jgi:hypothetical protein
MVAKLLTVIAPVETRAETAARATGHAEPTAALSLRTERRRNRADPAFHRRLGDVRRKPGADRRAMAYSRSGSILPDHGNNLDYPFETIDSMDSDRLFQKAAVKPATANIERTVLLIYISAGQCNSQRLSLGRSTGFAAPPRS